MKVSRVEGLVPPVQPVAKRLRIHQRELSDSTSARRNDIGMLPSVKAGWWAVVSVTRSTQPLLADLSASASPTVRVGPMGDCSHDDRVGRIVDRIDDAVGATSGRPLTFQFEVQRLAHAAGIRRDRVNRLECGGSDFHRQAIQVAGGRRGDDDLPSPRAHRGLR